MPILFRVAKNNPARTTDFLSECQLGRPPRADETTEDLLSWLGISIWATEAQARAKAVRWPSLGRYIAVLDLPASPSIVIRRTFPASRGHHTIWSTATQVANSVTRTIAV